MVLYESCNLKFNIYGYFNNFVEIRLFRIYIYIYKFCVSKKMNESIVKYVGIFCIGFFDERYLEFLGFCIFVVDEFFVYRGE